MALELQSLKDELTNNPIGMAYLALTAENDVANANAINNADGTNPRTINNSTVDTGDIRGNTTFDGFDGLTTAEQAWFEWLTVNGVIPVNAETLEKLAGIPTANQAIWAAADRTAMNAAMTALMQFQGSRAQEISDTLGVSIVAPADVRDARLLP